VPAPWHVGALALCLATASLWPLAAVFNWFGVNVATLEQMGRTDPLGFRVLPAFLMFLRPVIAGAAALSMPFAAVKVVTSRPPFAVRILLKAAITQAVLVLALVITGGPVNTTLSQLMPMFADRRTPGALVSPGHFVALQETAAAAVIPSLAGIAAACGLLGMLARATLSRLPGARAG
jgi:hypothetical protein